jgi:small subunit ribosomal protein S2
MAAQADLAKLRANLGGVKNMARLPQAMFVIDLKTEAIAVREAQRLRIPIIGVVDTNCDPDGIDFVVPGNDDAIRSCDLVTRALGDVIREGRTAFTQAEEERMRREAEEAARRQAEEQAKRDAEEQAKSAEEAARREALVQSEGGGDRQVAEAEVAEAVQSGGRVQPDPKVAPKANQDIATPDPPGQPPSPEAAPAAEADGPIVNADLKDQAGVEAEPPEPQPDTPDAEAAGGDPISETEKESAS